jgi:hypothetical protein
MVIRATPDSPADTGWMIGPYGARMIVERLRSAGFEIRETA